MRKEYDFSRGRRGAVAPVGSGKTRITIRIDDDVLEWFRKEAHACGGASYQAMINEALREHIAHGGEPLAETLRRVLREERAASEQPNKAPQRTAQSRRS